MSKIHIANNQVNRLRFQDIQRNSLILGRKNVIGIAKQSAEHIQFAFVVAGKQYCAGGCGVPAGHRGGYPMCSIGNHQLQKYICQSVRYAHFVEICSTIV
jgi:hypothetical protein